MNYKFIAFMVLFLLAGVGIGPIISINAQAQDATWTTTADFDSGTKNQPGDGNYGVETLTDNLRIADSSMELASLKSDTFYFADTDADTFKWNPVSTGSLCATKEIIGGVLSTSITGSSSSDCGVVSATTLTGDYDVRAKFVTTVAGSNRRQELCTYDVSGSCDAGLTASSDGPYIRNLAGTILQTFNMTNSVFTQVGSNTDPTCPLTIWLRITRVGSTYTTYYSCNGSAWTQDETFIRTGLSAVYANIAQGNNGAVDGFMNIDDFLVATGTVGSGGFRISGDWISPTIPLPENRRVDFVRVTYSNVNAGNYITRVEFIRNSSVDQEFDSDLTSGTSHDYNATSVLRGLSNFNFRIYLIGNGSSTPVIESIEVFLMAIEPLSADPTELLILILLFAMFIFLFVVGLYNRFVMVGASIVSVFLAIQTFTMTENIVLPAFFIFIMAVCIGLSITKKG